MSTKEQLADAAAGLSVATFLGLSLADWNELVHILAGVVAIVAGVAAATFHIARTKHLKQTDMKE